jgi:hypothetical protein
MTKKFIFFSFFILILSIFLYLYLFEIEYFPIIELDNSYNAKCLDGSNYRFNFIPCKNDGKNKFFLYFEGGGWCGQETLVKILLILVLKEQKLQWEHKLVF